jgi:type II secretory pathway pseudopilin PulG
MKRHTNTQGFTLVELVIIILLIGIVAALAVREIGTSLETAKYEHTKKELEQLAYAIAGNPSLYNDGARIDFGYVGDVGSMPPNLDALVQNPGGYSTWQGPYITTGLAGGDFKKDAWNTPYVYTDTLLRSTGSGTNIDKLIANSTADLLANTVEGYIVDADRQVPGSNNDSIKVSITYPNGSGGYTTSSQTPSAKGNFAFSNIPIGNQTLRVIYLPKNDTLTYEICINPGSTTKLDIVFPADLW